MKENPSPGPRKQHAFSPKRPIAALLVITATLSFALLFASGGQTYAASSASASVLSTPTASTPLTVSLFLLGNAVSIPVNEPLTLSAQVTTSDPNETVAKVAFYSSTGGSTPTLIGTAQVVSSDGTYEVSWTPSAPIVYSLTAKAYDTLGNVATSNTVTANIVVPTPPPALGVTVTSPSNGSVYTLPAQIPFTAGLYNVVGVTLYSYTIDYYATLEPNGPTYRVGSQVGTSPPIFTVTWVPSQAGTYSLVIKAEVIDEAGYQSGTSAPITVQINAPAGGSCTVHYQLESQWSGGFSANVVLTNTSSVTINGWTLAFTFPGDQQITELWNGSFAQTGEQVSITNLSYNGTIKPGGTDNLGFNGAWISNESSPTAFTLNGHSCSTT